MVAGPLLCLGSLSRQLANIVPVTIFSLERAWGQNHSNKKSSKYWINPKNWMIKDKRPMEPREKFTQGDWHEICSLILEDSMFRKRNYFCFKKINIYFVQFV